MRGLTGGEAVVQIEAANLSALIENLERLYPGMRERIIDDEDESRLIPGLAAVIDGDASTQGLLHKLVSATEVHFLPAIAGGA
jgi:molybdopterin synthase sulfur carrier subunit